MAKPVHSNIRVLDEQRSIAFYQQAFDLDLVDRVTFDDFTLLFLRNRESEFELELTINHALHSRDRLRASPRLRRQSRKGARKMYAARPQPDSGQGAIQQRSARGQVLLCAGSRWL